MATNKIFSYEVEGDGIPVDMTRDEFVRFQTLVSQISGPLRTRTVTLVFSLLLGGSLLLPELLLWWRGDQPDFMLMAVVLLTIGASLVLWAVTPLFHVRRAEKQYDSAIEAGQSYFGLLRIYDDRLEKAKPDYSLTIPFGQQAMLIEDATMFVLMNRARQAIIIPARCITAEQAQSIRAAADNRMPPSNRRFVSRLEPLGQPALLPPSTEGEVLFVDTIRYTPEEYTVVAKELTTQQFWRRAPLLCSLCVLVALAFGWDGQNLLPVLGWFAGAAAVLTLFNLVLPLRRIQKMAPHMRTEQLSVRVTVDYRGVRLLKDNQGEGSMPWSAVKHVYDAESFVKFAGKQEFYLPKRCIPDLETFSADIDRYMNIDRLVGK